MLRFCSLGSGSGGNATVVEARSGNSVRRVLVDCGFPLREIDRRLARAGLGAGDIDAVFVTHEHGDHVGSAVALSERDDIPLWMSRGTWRAIGEPVSPARVGYARDGVPLAVGDLALTPFTVTHDAAEPLQLRCSDGAVAFGVLTDAGSITPHMLDHLRGCAALLLEFNHDPELLAASRYPPSVKARIGGRYGHLCNATAAEILGACMHDRLQHVVAAHLSRQNNSPAHVRAALADLCGTTADGVVIADPHSGFEWLEAA